MSSAKRIRVLHFPGLETPLLNPFVELLLIETSRGVDIIPFTWRSAFLKKYEIAHWHWPEYFGSARSTKGRVFYMGVVVLFAIRLKLTRVHVIRTVHNVEPHSGQHSLLERLSLRIAMACETHRVYLTDPPRPIKRVSVIKHCSYPVNTDRNIERPTDVIGFFGSVLPYKGVERLIRVFIAEVDDPQLSLTVAGQTPDPNFRELLTTLADADPRVFATLRKLSDKELATAIQACDLVVLPYEKMYNSGAALLALSYGRPILVPDVASMRELGEDVGVEWVITFTQLSGSTLTEAISAAQELARQRRVPDLSRRSPALMGQMYVDLYKELAS